jgi:hypothetical protein
MAARMVIHDSDDLEAVPGVKAGGLERERHEQNLLATSPASLFFCCPKQSCPQSLFASRFLYPELPDFQAAAPRVATDSGNDATSIVFHEDRQPLAVCDACRTRVQLVDAVLQVLDLISG